MLRWIIIRKPRKVKHASVEKALRKWAKELGYPSEGLLCAYRRKRYGDEIIATLSPVCRCDQIEVTFSVEEIEHNMKGLEHD